MTPFPTLQLLASCLFSNWDRVAKHYNLNRKKDFCVKKGPKKDHFSSLVLKRTKSLIKDLYASTVFVFLHRKFFLHWFKDGLWIQNGNIQL